MFAEIRLKLTSKTELNTTKRPTLQSSKEADLVYVLQPKADHQGSKILFHGILVDWWIGLYNIESFLPINLYLVRKIGTNKMQVLQRMRMRQFTPRQPIPDIRITPQDWTTDPEVSLKYDDLYARAWECEYEKPNFDAESANATPPISP